MVTYDQLIPPLTRMPIRMAVKRLLLRQSAKAGGGGAAPCECAYHQHAYNEVAGTIADDPTHDYMDIGPTGDLVSQAITLTEECCVLAVGEIIARNTHADFELERPKGTIVVDQEDETITNSMYLNHYAAWEVLPAGIYTYFLVNRSGGARRLYAANLKIIASDCLGVGCTCQHHADAFNQDGNFLNTELRDVRYTTFANAATILSVTIVTTEECCINCVSTLYSDGYVVTDFELERPKGTIVVDQEASVPSGSVRLVHHSSWEVLPAGIYTYFLVNRRGSFVHVHAAQMKVVAFACG